MAKLNQIIAIEKGIKQQSYGAITELHRIVQKAELFNGLHKQHQSGWFCKLWAVVQGRSDACGS